jgi:sugar lactone lactonase YvrE
MTRTSSALIWLVFAAIAFVGSGPAAAAPSWLVQPGDFIVDVEGTTCPLGGPILRVTSSGQVGVIAQGGLLKKPRGNAVDAEGNLIVADPLAGMLLKVNLASGTVTKIAGSPPFAPHDVAIDAQGNYVVVDWPGHVGRSQPPAVYQVSPAGQARLLAQGSPLASPHGIALDAAGNVIVAQAEGLVRVTPGGVMELVQATRPGQPQQLFGAADVRVDADGNYIAAGGDVLALVRPAGGEVDIIHRGPPFRNPTGPQDTVGLRGVVIDSNGDYVLADGGGGVYRITPRGELTKIATGGLLCQPADVTIFRPLPAAAPPVTRASVRPAVPPSTAGTAPVSPTSPPAGESVPAAPPTEAPGEMPPDQTASAPAPEEAMAAGTAP